MENSDAYQHAKQRIQVRTGFKIHLAVYLAVILILLILNLTTSPEDLWVLWPAFGWGIGLIFHGLNTYVFLQKTTITDEMIRKEMEKTGNP